MGLFDEDLCNEKYNSTIEIKMGSKTSDIKHNSSSGGGSSSGGSGSGGGSSSRSSCSVPPPPFLVADSAEEFARAVIDVYTNRTLSCELSRSGFRIGKMMQRGILINCKFDKK